VGERPARQLKKILVNKQAGLCGKWQNTKSDTLAFHSKSEADRYLQLLGGEDGGAQLVARIVGDRTLYFVHRCRTQELCDGLWPIQHYV
jgi:hypothetical protein